MHSNTRNKLNKLAQALAEAMNWTTKDVDGHVHLVGPNGEEFHLRQAYNDDRVTVVPDYPRDGAGDVVMGPSKTLITFSDKRHIVDIAKDIERRFLPQYRIQLDTARVLIARTDQIRAQRQQGIHLITEALGAAIGPKDRNNSDVLYLRCKSEGREWYGDFTANADDVDIMINSVPYEVAVRIARLLGEYPCT